jgi:PAS domain-containing protein
VFWPAEDAQGSFKPRGAAAADDRLWRAVVDAVPEPAIVLGDAGQVLHANRMAGDLFGIRRRGGHITTMVRDPELLAAVEQAWPPGKPGSSNCTRACPSSAGC